MDKLKQLKKNKRANIKTISLIILLVAILASFYYMNNLKEEKNGTVGIITESTDEINWKTYVNRDYNFQIDFPSHWHVFEDFSGPAPVVNFYLRLPGSMPPFNHFSKNPNVSVFPEGVPTDGIIGTKIDATAEVFSDNSEINLREEPSSFISYLLNDDSVWAKMVNFSNIPESWQSWGFLWSRARISNYDERCFQGDNEVELRECNIFEGDEIVRFGEVDENIREIQIRMLNSFQFID